jgi:hypothetical protein
MSRPPADTPERLLASDATDFERRVLEAALENKPTPASSARMARALGVRAAAAATAVAATTMGAQAAASKAAGAAATTSTVWALISAGVLGAIVAGAIVGVRTGRDEHARQAAPPAVPAPAAPGPAPSAADQRPGIDETTPRTAVSSQHGRAGTGGDLADQVALIDLARTAMSGGANRRALAILRRYSDRYPAGSFRPEASALEIEALMKLGRETEARALAERFVAEHRGSLMARRVAEVAGLTPP